MISHTQLFEGAHLTDGNMRFVASQANVAITRFFVGQIIKYGLRIIIGFDSNGLPSNNNSDSNVPLQIFEI